VANVIRRVLFLISLISASVGLPARAAIFYVSVNGTNPVPPYADWGTASTDVQSAIDVASDGDLVLVTNGIYGTGGRVVYGSLTNRVAINKAVTLQSVNGPAVTEISGNLLAAGSTNYANDVRGVYMTNNAILDGFTVANGSAFVGYATDLSVQAGGGVYCESTNAVLTNCILLGNVCYGGGGGGIYKGILFNCVLTNNQCSGYAVPGGAASMSVLINCMIISNSATFGGGAAKSTLDHCSVMQNIAPYLGSSSFGGGTYLCTATHCLIAGNLSTGVGGGDYDGILTDCILSNNLCLFPNGGTNGSGGGSCQVPPNSSYTPKLVNCLIVSNCSSGCGGGVACSRNGAWPVVANCTIIGNTASNQGGGVYGGTVTNSIIYANANNFMPSAANYFLTSVTDCWTNDPGFVNPGAGDYHLASNSPCINSGNNAFVSAADDLDGNLRIAGGTVDLGCYEYQSPTSVISYAWLEQYGLPTNGSVDYADSDGTGMNNWQKWIAGLNPTNPVSMLLMESPSASNSTPGITVTWQSVSTRTYYLQRTPDLTVPFSAIQSNLIGRAGFTSFIDQSATNAGPYFYRVGVQ
jgi:hypothetical protein